MCRPVLLVLLVVLLAGCAASRPVDPLGGIDPSAWLVGDHDAPPGFATLTVANAGEAAFQRLAITRMDVAVHIEGRLARTRLTQVFQNALPSAVEGVYELTLPPGAAVTRLAMDVDGVMTEGELVERAYARAVYRRITTTRRDPALMEWQGAQRFRTRIFPIPAHGTKTLVVEVEQVLPELPGGGLRYVQGLPRVVAGDGAALGALSFELDYVGPHVLAASGTYPVEVGGEAGGRQHASLALEAFVPRGDLALTLRPAPTEPRSPTIHTATRAFAGVARAPERFFAADLVLGAGLGSSGPPERVVFVLDTSASLRGAALDGARAIVRETAARLGHERVRVVHGALAPQRCDPGALEACLAGLEAAGATDLPALVAAALEEALANDASGRVAVVVLSDGASTLSGTVYGSSAVDAPLDARGVHLHTLAVGAGALDEGALRALSSAHGGHHLRVPPSAPAGEVASVLVGLLGVPVVSGLEVVVVEGEVEGASVSAATVPAGSRVLVLGRMVSDSAVVELRGEVEGESVVERVAIGPASPDEGRDPLLSHLWARARIERLEARDEVLALSMTYGVMSPYTSLLVLESERMYRDANIARRQEAEHGAAQARGERPEDAVGAAAYEADWHGLGERGIEAAQPERRRGFTIDSDGDGIIDAYDLCPIEREVINGLDDEDGCPDVNRSQKVLLGSVRMHIREQIHFAPGSRRIAAEQEDMMDRVAKILRENPHIAIEIDGHTDDREIRASRRERLSRQRAEAVREALVARGVEAWRFTVEGFGDERPIEIPETREGRAKNRRVEFRLREADGALARFARIEHLHGLAERTLAEDIELVVLQLEQGHVDAAETVHETLVERYTAAERISLYADRPLVCRRFPDACRAAALAVQASVTEAVRVELYRLALKHGDVEALDGLAETLMPADPIHQLDVLQDALRLARRNPQGRIDDTLDESLGRDTPHAAAERILEGWRPRLGAEQRIELLGRLDAGRALPGPTLDAVHELIDAGQANAVWLDIGRRAAEAAGTLEAYAPHLVTFCATATALDALEGCALWLDEGVFAGHEDAPTRATLDQRDLAEVLAQRQDDAANPELIERHARHLDALGRPEAALLTLTEMVELAPHDPQAHHHLATLLAERDEPWLACLALAGTLRTEATRAPTPVEQQVAVARLGLASDAARRCLEHLEAVGRE